jgi:hypothetical protein
LLLSLFAYICFAVAAWFFLRFSLSQHHIALPRSHLIIRLLACGFASPAFTDTLEQQLHLRLPLYEEWNSCRESSRRGIWQLHIDNFTSPPDINSAPHPTTTSQLHNFITITMDPIAQLSQKLAAEQVYQSIRQQPTPPETAPPPYTPSDLDSDSEDEDEADEEPMKLTINAAHRVQGSNNLVPTSATPLADATRFSTLLLTAVNQINRTAEARPRRGLKVDLTINCGITVVGDRNVIGNVAVKPRTPAQAVAGPSVATCSASSSVAGAKRKAEDDESSLDGREVKRASL